MFHKRDGHKTVPNPPQPCFPDSATTVVAAAAACHVGNSVTVYAWNCNTGEVTHGGSISTTPPGFGGELAG